MDEVVIYKERKGFRFMRSNLFYMSIHEIVDMID